MRVPQSRTTVSGAAMICAHFLYRPGSIPEMRKQVVPPTTTAGVQVTGGWSLGTMENETPVRTVTPFARTGCGTYSTVWYG